MDDSIKEKTRIVQFVQPGSREFFSFLLGNSANSQSLPLENLPTELEIVASGSHLPDQVKAEEIEELKRGAQTLADEIVAQHHLDDKEKVALEDLFLGFTQANLLEKGVGFEHRIDKSETTGYPFPQRHERDILKASPRLFSIVSQIFDRVILIDKGIQIRTSSNPLFLRSVARVNTIIQYLGGDPFKYPPVIFEIAPLYKANTLIGEWSDYVATIK